MSDPDNRAEKLLQRWSRRKQAALRRVRGSEPRGAPPNAEARSPTGACARGRRDQPAFDPATLPPIESITAASDIRAFLAPGVPEELTRAALRRMWVTDPAIRDFVGLAENQWDFTRPDSVPGFGSLELTPDLRRILARLVGEPTEQSAADGEQAQPIAETSDRLTPPTTRPTLGAANVALRSADPPLPSRRSNDDAATQPRCGEKLATPDWPRRKHGGALPK
jgi:hypothetical protein